MSTWPELGQELARKAFDVIEQRVSEHLAGDLDGPTLKLILDSQYDTISGLISDDDSRTISAIRKELGL